MDSQHFFVPLNQILASFTLILAFSLWAFIITYNRRSAIGRAFAVLLACMCFAYAGDVALFQVESLADAIPCLKFQWIGIAFIPAAYLHFSDALLRTTNAFSRFRRAAVMAGYALGGVFLYLAAFTTLLVRDGFFLPGVTQFRAGPLFWLFTLYFYAAVIWGVVNTRRARDRCLTSATRHRMTYLMLAFAAPSFGVFPYMLVANQASLLPPTVLLTVLFFVNIGIDLMIVFMAYNVSFFDAFAPDRVVKYVLATYLLRGPLIAALVILVILAMPDRSIIWGLPRDAILITLIVAIIVLAQIAASYLKPIISRLVYYKEREEVELLRAIDSRLLTTTDLRQALENILTAICELLRVRTGFIANVAARTGPRLETSVGEAAAIEAALTGFDAAIFGSQTESNGQSPFVSHGHFWYIPLKTRRRDH
ncbi:MAG: histidine kinase N-terminal 7TM domain-containing protein, partial [Anaerolineae bacterium]